MLSNFSSLFEIFCGINFAFVISNDFSKALFGKIITTFDNYKETKNLCDKLLDTIQDHLGKKDTLKNTKASESINKLAEEHKKLKEEFEVETIPLDERLKKLQENIAFNHYCLFGGLYSLFLLFWAGFNFESTNPIYNNILLAINIIFAILSLVVFSSRIKFCKSSYLYSILVIPTIIFVLFLATLLLAAYHPIHLDFFDFTLTILLSVFNITGHFIYLFAKSIYYKKSLGKVYETKIYDLKEKISRLQDRVTDRFDLLLDLDTQNLE